MAVGGWGSCNQTNLVACGNGAVKTKRIARSRLNVDLLNLLYPCRQCSMCGFANAEPVEVYRGCWDRLPVNFKAKVLNGRYAAS